MILKSEQKKTVPTPQPVDNSLNSNKGIDLNDPDVYEDYAKTSETSISGSDNLNFTINEFGEIIRPEGKSI